MKKMDHTHTTPKASLWLLVLLCTLLGMGTRLSAQCNPDVTPPTVAADEFTVVSVDANGEVEIMSSVFDDGSYDECCSVVTFEARRAVDGPCDGDNLPDDFGPTITFCCAEVDATISIEFKVSDCSGNTNTTIVQVTIQDKIKPTCIAPANVTVNCEAFDPSLVAYGMATGTDNCCFQSVSEVVDNSNFDETCNNGMIVRNFTATACNAQTSTCSQSITVNYVQDYYVRFPDDVISASSSQIPANAGEPQIYGEDCELMAFSYSDVITPNFQDSLVLVERNWTVINWCTYNPVWVMTTVPNPNPVANPLDPANLAGVVVSPEGTPAPWSPTIVNLGPNAPTPTNFSQFYTPNATGFRYTQYIYVLADGFVGVEGQVFADNNANCALDGGEPTLANWKLKCVGTTTGSTSTTYADASGHYKFYVPNNETNVVVTLESPLNVSGNCPLQYSVNVAQGTTATQNIGVTLNSNCTELTADISASFVRRCFNNTYFVQVYNSGTETVADASVTVQLDTFMTLLWSSMPNIVLGNNLFKYELGDMTPGQVARINITYNLSCNAPLGYTHCVTAHAYPDEICGNGQAWSGPVTQVKGRCDGDKVRFEIENIGNQDMTTPLEFIVVEDVLMLKNLPNATFELNTNDVQSLEFDANGATWRVIAQQTPDYPYGGTATAVVEGCGGLNQTGLVNLFSNEPSTPYIATDCRENIGAFDPNDKQAFPVGFGTEHFIEQNTELEYLIRFQNTGTDTAFTVVVRDPLSALLDPASVGPGASSHAYTFSLENNNELVFRFENILLPDSNINEAASHGFVEFKVRQKADNPLGSIIQNKAAIYFDFNDPVITNIVNHTIGKDFIPTVGTNNPTIEAAVTVTPNPATDQVLFTLPNGISNGHLQITDTQGKVVRMANIVQSTYRLERAGLASGNYWYHITATNGQVFAGKVVLK